MTHTPPIPMDNYLHPSTYKKLSIAIGLQCISLCFAIQGYALPSDQKQLLHIQSHQLTVEYGKRKAIYQGQVIATQGSRYLSGNTLTLNQNTQGQVNRVLLKGNPAHGHYQAETGQPDTYSKAKTMLYQPLKNLITFNSDAHVMHNGNVFNGPVITYNTRSQIVTTPQDPNTRNTMILQPYDQLKKTQP